MEESSREGDFAVLLSSMSALAISQQSAILDAEVRMQL
jgi:hypothetical protein